MELKIYILSEEEEGARFQRFRAGGGGDAYLGKGFRRNVEGFEGGLELLPSLGESCFDELLGYGPGGRVVKRSSSMGLYLKLLKRW